MPRSKATGPARGRGRTLGMIIRQKRELLGLSRQRLAVDTAISAEELKKLELGAIASPGFFALAAICNRLGIDLNSLVSRATKDANDEDVGGSK